MGWAESNCGHGMQGQCTQGKNLCTLKKKILTASKEKQCGRKKKTSIAEAIKQEAKTSIQQTSIQSIWSLQVAQRSRKGWSLIAQ